MRFTYAESSPQQEIVDAIAFLELAADSDGFWQGIAELPPFTQLGDPNGTPAAISACMRSCETVVTVRHYTADNTATARVRSGNPFLIEINTKFFGRGTRAYVNTLCHEFVHVVDFYADTVSSNGQFNYGHTRRYTSKRPHSAPYRIGRFAEEWWNIAHPHEQVAKSAFDTDMLDCDIDDGEVVLVEDRERN